MATPVAVTNGLQTFAYGDLPQLVQLDGTGSYDADGGVITAYAWTLQSKPLGSTAALSDAAIANPTFTADLPGSYLVTLVVSVGATDSSGDLFGDNAMPDSAQAVIDVTSQHLGLVSPAAWQRSYSRAVQAAIAALDAMAGSYIAHATDGSIHWGKATDATYGVSKLTAAPAVAGAPVAVSDSDARWALLVGGVASNADSLHTHTFPSGSGRHHDLRPDLLVGANDKRWTSLQIGALSRSHNVGGTREAYAAADGDGLLSLEIQKADDRKTAGVLWDSPADDFEAIIDLRLSFDGAFLAQDVNQYLEAGFGWQSGAALGTPERLLAAGLVLSDWGFRAADFGASDTTDGGATADWNADSLVLTPLVRTGLLVTEFCVRIRRTGTAVVGEVGSGGGGFVRIASWTGAPTTAGKFCLFGSLKRAAIGLRIKSTGFRIRTPDTWFGA